MKARQNFLLLSCFISFEENKTSLLVPFWETVPFPSLWPFHDRCIPEWYCSLFWEYNPFITFLLTLASYNILILADKRGHEVSGSTGSASTDGTWMWLFLIPQDLPSISWPSLPNNHVRLLGWILIFFILFPPGTMGWNYPF